MVAKPLAWRDAPDANRIITTGSIGIGRGWNRSVATGGSALRDR